MASLIGRMGASARNLAKSVRSSPEGAAAAARASAAVDRGGGILESISGSLDAIPSPLRKGLIAGGIGMVAMNQFSSGVDQVTGGISEAFYETVTGVPDIDKQVFGQHMSPLDLLNPINIPGPRIGAVAGGLAGGAIGYGAGRGLFGRGKLGMVAGAAMGVAASLDPAERRNIGLATNPTMINRHFIARKENYWDEGDVSIRYLDPRQYRNNMPGVNGNMVIGMYNSRGH